MKYIKLYEEKIAIFENNFEVEFKKSLKKYIVWYVLDLEVPANILIIEIFDVYDSGNVELQLLYEYKKNDDKIKKLNFEKLLTSEPIIFTEKERILYQSDNLENCIEYVNNYGHAIHFSKTYNL